MRHPTDEEIQDLVDGVLDASRSIAVSEHLASCGECRAVVADVKSLLEAAAGLAVGADPPADEWERIEARISDVRSRPTNPEPTHPRHMDPEPRSRPASSPEVGTFPSVDHVETRPSAMPSIGLRRAAGWILLVVGVGGGAFAIGGLRDGSAPAIETTATSPADAVSDAYAESVYELELIFAEGAGQLAPETLGVIEENLLLIDEAVERARAEIARDPGSGALARSLNSLYGAKVRVLAQAVALADER